MPGDYLDRSLFVHQLIGLFPPVDETSQRRAGGAAAGARWEKSLDAFSLFL